MSGPERLSIYHLVTRLRRPYVLPFGRLEQFDSFVAIAEGADGWYGIGESTPLPGYSHETPDLVDEALRGLAHSGDLESFLRTNATHPFVTSTVLSCLEGPLPDVSGPVTLCPILQWNDYDEIAPQVRELGELGNSVVKVKVGPELAASIKVARLASEAARPYRIRLRYDANQTLSQRDAHTLVDELDEDTTELLEQPFPPAAWAAIEDLHRYSQVPLMLDESIVDEASLERAANCASLVKLKVAKNGSPQRLLHLIGRARELGLDVILGNGAQGTVGCLIEGRIQLAAGLERAGEMNGYRKIHNDSLDFLLEDAPTGCIIQPGLPLTRVISALERASRNVYCIPKL